MLSLVPNRPPRMSAPAKTLNALFTAGYVAKGVVYFLVGGLTLATVLGFSMGGSGAEGPKGVLRWVEDQPLGNVLVGALGLGLLAYAAWRIYRGAADPRDEGKEASSLAKRAGYVFSGLANGTLGVLALRLALGGGSGSGGGGAATDKQGMVAQLLEQPWGPWLVGAVGVGVVCVGGYQVYKGVKAKFVDNIHWRDIDRKVVKRVGRYGFFARGLVFAIIGYFLVLAAVQSNASEFRGTEGALEYLTEHSYGIWLLGVVSAGLLLFGVFSVMKGRYGSIRQGV